MGAALTTETRMTAATLVSTDNFAPRERAPVWREWIFFGGPGLDLYGDTDFGKPHGIGTGDDVILTRLEANRHRVRLAWSAQ
jgi:hypothetical protein